MNHHVKLHVHVHVFILCSSPQECQLHGRSLLSALFGSVSSALRIVPGTSQVLEDSLIWKNISNKSRICLNENGQWRSGESGDYAPWNIFNPLALGRNIHSLLIKLDWEEKVFKRCEGLIQDGKALGHTSPTRSPSGRLEGRDMTYGGPLVKGPGCAGVMK